MTKRIAALAACACVVSVGAQQQSGPTFRSSVDLVTLDIRAVDRSGRFVSDLTPADLKVFEDGREQTISTFDRVNVPRPGGAATSSNLRPAPAAPTSSDVASNDGVSPADSGDGRLYVVVLDDLHTNPARSADVRALARDFVEHHLSIADQAVVLTTSGRQRAAPAFTANHERLLETIDGFRGDDAFATRALCEDSAPNPAQCSVGDDRASLRSLAAISDWLKPVAGRRKALLLFSEGLSVDQAAYMLGSDPTIASNAPVGDTSSGDPTQTPGGVRLEQNVARAVAAYAAILPDLQAAEGAAARANVSIYPLDPRRHPEALFSRIVEETSSYYLLGYVPTNARHDGTFRKIDVRSVRPGVKIESRKGYTAKSDEAPKAAETTDVSAALRQLMEAPVQVSGLTLRAAAAVFAGAQLKSSVEVITEVAGYDLTAASVGKGSLALLMTMADANGRIQATERGTLDMNLSDATRDSVAQHGIRLMSRLEVPSGRYVLRVAAVDGAGASRGSVQLDVDVLDFSKTRLAMSSISIAASSDLERPNAGSDAAWRDRFVQPPTTLRAFDDTDDLLVSGEIYHGDGQSEAMESTTTVQNASGEVVFTREHILSERIPDRPSASRYQTMIPLQDMEAGDYVLTVESAAPGIPQTVMRRLAFSVR